MLGILNEDQIVHETLQRKKLEAVFVKRTFIKSTMNAAFAEATSVKFKY